MCDTIVWFYGQNYKGDMESMIRQFRNKRKTMDQKRKFNAAELERHIDLAFQTWAERVARQVSDLEKDRTFNEERTHDGDGKPVGLWGVRPLYTLLLRCFLAEKAKAAVELEVFAVERVRAAEREAEKKAAPQGSPKRKRPRG